MSFGLKNAETTYQRMVNYMFTDQFGKTMEVYINHLVVKSEKKEDHLVHLVETFEIIRKFNMRLNPKRCNFGVELGKLLGQMVSKRGIEANPTKIKDILYMSAPRNIKEVQRLAGRLVAHKFISDGG